MKMLLPKLLLFSIIYVVNYMIITAYQIHINDELYDIGGGYGYFFSIGFKIFIMLLSSHLLFLYSLLMIYVSLIRSYRWKS
ncbi:MAG: hypothetical protein ACRC0X_04080 [Brevinema sp.]